MSKIVLDEKPTFDLPVAVSRLGGGKVEISVTFKGISNDEYDQFVKDAQDPKKQTRNNSEVLLAIATGWNLDVPFTAEGIDAACNRSVGLPGSIVRAFMDEYSRVRTGN